MITTIAIEETTANIAYKNLITFGATKVSNLKSNNDFNSKLYKTYLDIKKVLKENNFYSKNFYRLHKMHYLINNKMLDSNILKRL